jgi:RHS repeat-associated protein
MYENGGSVAVSTLPFAFDGERQDGASTLYYLSARFYNPMLGRFLSADTQIHNPSTPQALNRYTFAGGNPIRYVDPSGHSWWDYLLAVVVLAAVSGGAGLALITAAAAVVGLGVGAAVAAGMGYSPGSDTFWQIALTGALIGAALGAGAGPLITEGSEAAELTESAEEFDEFAVDQNAADPATEKPTPSTARSVASDMTKAMAFGAPQSVLIHELQGGGTDGLLNATMTGTVESAVSGAIIGRITAAGSAYALGPGTIGGAWNAFAAKLAVTVVTQGALWTFAGLEHQSVGSYVGGKILQGGSDLTTSQDSSNLATGGSTPDNEKDRPDY